MLILCPFVRLSCRSPNSTSTTCCWHASDILVTFARRMLRGTAAVEFRPRHRVSGDGCCRYCAKLEVTETRRSCARHDWTRRLTPGTLVCVECQQLAVDDHAGRGGSAGRSRGRCAGHGVFERETAWKAVGVRRCHGKWTLVSRHVQPCQCDPRRDTSFVFV